VKRGDFYLVQHPTSADSRRQRVFVVVGRQAVIDSRFSTVICAPVYSVYDGLASQVPVGANEGLKHDSSIHCDELVSLLKTSLTDFVGRLSSAKIMELNSALHVALEVTD